MEMKTVTIPEVEYQQLKKTIAELKAKLALLAELESLMPWLKKAAIKSQKELPGYKEKKLPIVYFERTGEPVPMKFGAGKNLITHMADDFNAPLEDFQDYM